MTEWKSDQLVFLDESAANEQTPNWRYEWTPRGFSCHVRRSCKRSHHWSILSAISLADYIAVDVYQKSYNSSRFRKFVHFHVLSKCILKYNVLVMNNFNTHQSSKLVKLCRKVSVELVFLPSYLLNYNLIEQSFHVLKKWMWRHQDIAKSSQYKNDYEEFIWLAIRFFMKEKNASEYFKSSDIEYNQESYYI